MEDDREGEAAETGADGEEEEYEGSEEEGIDFRFVDAQDDMLKTYRAGPKAEQPVMDRERLESVLKELVACRDIIDRALKDG